MKNMGLLKIKLFNFTIINVKISFVGYYFNLVDPKQKVVQIKLDLRDENLRFINDLQKNLLSKVYFLSFNTNCEIGLFNAKTTSESIGLFYFLISQINNKLNRNGKDCYINTKIVPNYINNEFKICFDTILIVSIFDFLWAIAIAVLNRRFFNERRKKRKI